VHTQIAKEIVQHLIEQDRSLKRTNVLVMGITFKENVSDIRNSKVPELIRELEEFKINVDAIDPFADADEVREEYGIAMIDKLDRKYDAVVLAVNHKQYLELDETYFAELSFEDSLFYDVKGIYRDRFKKLKYLSL
jgi:UDP-N-acetyl-D-galactosamine dehydrogenase